MYFNTLYLLRGETLDNVNTSSIYESFGDRWCNSYGEHTPKYGYYCDWFQIGGRWVDELKASKGLYGDTSWTNEGYKHTDGNYSVCEIKDLTEPIGEDRIYAIATKSKIYYSDTNEVRFKELLDKINDKKIKGVVALIDCHD